MTDHTGFRASSYLAPRYWPTWLGLGLLRSSLLLSYPAMLRLGRLLGHLLYLAIPSRRRVVLTNLQLCFPSMDQAQREHVARESVIATATAVFEGALSWWGNESHLRQRYRIEGLEHLERAQAQGKGVLLLGGHFTTLEISGRLLSFHINALQPIYKPAKNPLFDAVMTHSRRRLFDDLVPNSDLRGIVRRLKAGKVMWYAPDQDFGHKQTVFAPFFGVATATLTTTARLAKLSGAPVLPYYSQRLPGNEGFLICLSPALQDFPSGDDLSDATRTNKVLEEQIREAPEQYLWVHKRFKTRPPGEARVY